MLVEVQKEVFLETEEIASIKVIPSELPETIEEAADPSRTTTCVLYQKGAEVRLQNITPSRVVTILARAQIEAAFIV